MVQLSAGQLQAMVAAGSLFTIEVDGVGYFPSLLAGKGVDRKRLHSICRILVPAPADCRLGYLESRQANIGGLSPIEALRRNESYQLLREMATAYASEWWRTCVTIYEGAHPTAPTQVRPVLTALCEMDPRINLWKRAISAIESGGYLDPPGPYPNLRLASVFILLQPSGQTDETEEARIDVLVDGDVARASVLRRGAAPYTLEGIPVNGNVGVVDMVLRSIKSAKTHEARLRAK